jgi:hypothetical protein
VSRGPGRVQQVILAAIRAPEAAAARDDGTGPAGARIEAVWQELYGTETPTRAQRQSVQHAIDRLGPEVVQARSWRRYLGQRRPAGQRTRTRPPWRWNLCTASTGFCNPCYHGLRRVDAGAYRDIIKAQHPEDLELALLTGIHVWQDLLPHHRVTETIETGTWYGGPAGWIARPSTQAELEAEAAEDEARMARFRAAVGRER